MGGACTMYSLPLHRILEKLRMAHFTWGLFCHILSSTSFWEALFLFTLTTWPGQIQA
jgi:hypothetical protein